jgi:drug/metabolite transporter (DMT)-like permease
MDLMLSYALLAALMYAIPLVLADSLSKRMVRKVGAYRLGTIMLAIGFIPAIIAAVIVGVDPISMYSASLAVITGFAISVGYVLFYKTMETEQISNSIALSELSAATFVIFGFVVFGESIGLIGAIGVITVFIGAGLVAITEELKFNSKLIPATAAFIVWAAGFIVFAYSIKTSGTFAMPLIIVKLTALLSFAFVARFAGFRKPSEKLRSHATGIITTGLFDGTGTAAFGLVTMLAAIGLTGVINAVTPVLAAIIGYRYYKERFTKLQLTGFIIMVAGALVVSVA